MRKLEVKTTSEIIGGGPSERRCDRLLRRAKRNLDNARAFSRIIDTFDRIC